VIVDALEDMKAQDIAVFDSTPLTALFDRVIVVSGTSNRQTRSLAKNVHDKVKENGGQVYGMEGEETGEWVLVDCGDIVVHIQQPAIREYYRLEDIWGEKPVSMEEVIKGFRRKGPAKKVAAKKVADAEAAEKKAEKDAAKKPAAKKAASKSKGKTSSTGEKPVAKKAVSKTSSKTSAKSSAKPASKVGAKPAAKKPVAAKSAAGKPAAKKPAAKKPAAKK
jgi:ribosome-associated protein